MSSCPFCKQQVDDDLVRFGGHCPRCFIEIPGEETPTDPGAEAAGDGQEEGRGARRRIVGFLGLIIGVGALSAGVGLVRMHHGEAQVDDGPYEAPRVYMAPLEFHELPAKEEEPRSSGHSTRVGVSQRTSSSAGSSGSSGSLVTSGSSGSRVSFGSSAASADENLAEAVGRKTVSVDAAPVFSNSGGAGSLGGGLSSSGGSAGGISIRRHTGPDLALSDPAEIQKEVGSAIRSYGGQITGCYEQRLKSDENLRGVWELHFTVQQDGTTGAVQVVPRGMQDDELEDCMRRRALDWRFPRLAQPITFEQPYQLGT